MTTNEIMQHADSVVLTKKRGEFFCEVGTYSNRTMSYAAGSGKTFDEAVQDAWTKLRDRQNKEHLNGLKNKAVPN
jgi:hypothetical protein